MNCDVIAARYAAAGNDGLMQEFAALCLEAKGQPEILTLVETLVNEIDAGNISELWVNWQELNYLITRSLSSYEFGI